MLLPCGDKGCEATRDSPGPEGVRDSPRILEGRRGSFVVVYRRVESIVASSVSCCPVFGHLTILVNLTHLEEPGSCLDSVIRLCHSKLQGQ